MADKKKAKATTAEKPKQQKKTFMPSNEKHGVKLEDFWIPCSEHLPDLNCVVLTSSDKGIVQMGHRDEKVWWIDKWPYQAETVLAWMPKPKAYQLPITEVSEETSDQETTEETDTKSEE